MERRVEDEDEEEVEDDDSYYFFNAFHDLLSEYDETNESWLQNCIALTNEFHRTAEEVARMIIMREGWREELKFGKPTIPGQLGGEKFIRHGIFLKFAKNKQMQHDFVVGKIPSLEFKAANILFSVIGPKAELRVTLSTLIEYRGFKVFAMPRIKPNLLFGRSSQNQIKYDKDIASRLKEVTSKLNLAEHSGKIGDTPLPFSTPMDLEVHGLSGAFYLVDLSRLMPPDYIMTHDKRSLCSFAFRKECMQKSGVAIPSDARSGFIHLDDEQVAAARSIIEVQQKQASSIFKLALTLLLDAEPPRGFHLRFTESSRRMCYEIHKEGINLRYIGLLLAHLLFCLEQRTTEEISRIDRSINLLIMEMIVRALKSHINAEMREMVLNTTQEERTSEKQIIVQTLNFLLPQTDKLEPSKKINGNVTLYSLLEEKYFCFKDTPYESEFNYSPDLSGKLRSSSTDKKDVLLSSTGKKKPGYMDAMRDRVMRHIGEAKINMYLLIDRLRQFYNWEILVLDVLDKEKKPSLFKFLVGDIKDPVPKVKRLGFLEHVDAVSQLKEVKQSFNRECNEKRLLNVLDKFRESIYRGYEHRTVWLNFIDAIICYLRYDWDIHLLNENLIYWVRTQQQCSTAIHMHASLLDSAYWKHKEPHPAINGYINRFVASFSEASQQWFLDNLRQLLFNTSSQSYSYFWWSLVLFLKAFEDNHHPFWVVCKACLYIDLDILPKTIYNESCVTEKFEVKIFDGPDQISVALTDLLRPLLKANSENYRNTNFHNSNYFAPPKQYDAWFWSHNKEPIEYSEKERAKILSKSEYLLAATTISGGSREITMTEDNQPQQINRYSGSKRDMSTKKKWDYNVVGFLFLVRVHSLLSWWKERNRNNSELVALLDELIELVSTTTAAATPADTSTSVLKELIDVTFVPEEKK